MAPVSPLGEAQLLELWERGRDCHRVDRGLLLLGAALPDAPYGELADLPVGARDAALLALRRTLCGPHLEAFVACPRCNERLEITVDSSVLELAGPTTSSCQAGGHRFRLPTSRDLAVAVGERDPDRAARRLATICHVPTDDEGALEWSDALFADVEAGMALADPQADVQFAMGCDACGHNWSASFDIVQFLWEEIEARAVRLVQDVSLLARAFGWTETDVLALRPARRRTYITMATA